MSTETNKNDSPLLPGTVPFQADYDHLKKKVNDIAITVNGFSAGWDTAKLSGGFAAGGLTGFKADFTGFKVDEKGMSFLGKQITTWPWAESKEVRGLRRAKRWSDAADEASVKARAADRRARLNPEDSDLQLRAKLTRGELDAARIEAGKALNDLRKITRAAEQKKDEAKKTLRDAVTFYRQSTRELKGLERAANGASREIG
ncbi:hypothetical protein AB0I22_34175 [Streptomyces sp. NPDC050610]|uniref:hypothetical protein n=1 Tax=Streptomyces sp. NPDC050610 TaxID=3157097 RepID=UPI00342764ED